jgi:dTDP-glucose 4,6-dehydratase
MSKKFFLITGGSGFIGTNFCQLLSQKYKVINLDKLSYCSVPEKYKKINKKNYKFIKSDISNTRIIKKIFHKYKIDFLVNFASESHVDRSIDNPKKFIGDNINSTLSLLSTLKNLKDKNKLKNNFKFIHISTDEVYGSSFVPLNEKSKLRPNSPYSSSKASIDNILRSYGKTYNLPYIICRPCNNFGPYQFLEKFVPTIITKISKNKKIPLYGDGNNFREWINVEDTCKAILKICLKSKIYEIYNVGSSVRLKNIDLCKIIYKAKFKNLKNFNTIIEKVYDRPGHDRSYSINSNKLNKSICKTKVNKKYIIKKLEETVNWYFANNKWVNSCLLNFKGKRLG